MSAIVARLLRIPLTVAAVWAVLAAAVPFAMTQYPPYLVRPGLSCVAAGRRILADGIPVCRSLAELYHLPFTDLFVDSMFRSLALLVGAALLALTIGTLLGVVAALLRRRAVASAVILALTALLAAVPSFFVAYFLQVAVIVIGAGAEAGNLLPVFGFGYDGHLVLPLLSISIPAVAYTAQLTATRMADVLDSDFMTTAAAKGLRTSWILTIHVLPHVRPVLLEALGSGLRVSVASLPIVEFLFNWRGIGQLALEAVGVHDGAGFVFSAVVLAGLFATLSALADISRPQALFRAT
jgi:peptide/nickel transport system permease protein